MKPKNQIQLFSNIKFLAFSIVQFLCVNQSAAQIGGLNTFDFLNLASSARTTALSGFTPAIADEDIAQGFTNPAVVNSKMHQHLSFNHNFHFADISYGFFAYGHHLEKSAINLFVGGSYVSYGNFDRADIFGNRVGSFSGNETAFTVGASKKIDERLRIGMHLKYAHSNLDNYRSAGLGADLGLHYYNPEKNTNWAIVLKNIGSQITSYDIIKESFPVNIQIAFAKRLQHLPFQFMITAHNLQKWNLRSPLDDQGNVSFVNQNNFEPSTFSKSIDNLFRHLAFAGEFLLGKNEVVRLRMGYNHMRNKELSVESFRSLSGFSFGFGIRVKKITFDYGIGRYHLAGGVNHLNIGIDLDSLFSKL